MSPTHLQIQIDHTGGPEQLRAVQAPRPAAPGPGEVLIEQAAIGVNFIDVYHRTGLYPLALPATLGMEGAGTVRAVGDGVAHLREGDRVAYASQPPGAYAQWRSMPATHVCRLPDAVPFETAAAAMLKGLTVHYLLRKTLPVGGLQAGDWVLWHAAAGGVGLLACQWARHLGLRLIATAGSDEKCALALAAGAQAAINYRSTPDFAPRVRELTGGRGVKVVYDSVGKDTFEGSLDSLAPFGLLASFGNASGPIAPFAPGVLGAKGSLYLTRASLFSHLSSREGTQAMADDLFGVLASGAVRPQIGARYALAEAAQAHRDLEARGTTGSLLLIP